MPSTINFDDVFYGLSGKEYDLPHFDQLINIGRQLTDIKYSVREKSDEIDQQISSFLTICKFFKFTPLLIELSIIADLRTTKKEDEHNFYSFIQSAYDGVEGLLRPYEKAMLKMGVESNNGQPIITNKDLYKVENSTFFFVPFNHIDHIDHSDNLSHINSNGLTHIFRYPVPIDTKYTIDVRDQIDTFLSFFFEGLNEKQKKLFYGSLFILIPFTRPFYETPVEKGDRGLPGGAVFLFLRPENDSIWSPKKPSGFPLNSLIRAISWLCAEASIYESHSAFTVAEKDNINMIGSYNLLHPLKHRLGQLSQKVQSMAEEYEDDPRSEITKAEIKSTVTITSSVSDFAELAYLSHFSANHGHDATYRSKQDRKYRFSSEKKLDLYYLINNVYDSIKEAYSNNLSFKIEQNTVASIFVEPYYEIKNDEDSKIRLRLMDSVYTAILFELIGNCAANGKITTNGTNEIITLKLYLEKIKTNNGVENGIVFSNLSKNNNPDQHEKRWSRFIDKKTGGISFVNNILNNTKCGSYLYRYVIDESNKKTYSYEAALILKGLSCHHN